MTGVADTVEPPDLDDTDRLTQVDPQDALADVEGAAAQWRAAMDFGEDVIAPLDLVDNIVICGMGGSGIVADVVQSVAASTYDLPILVHKAPGLPGWAGGCTLVVSVSYSGNTAETLSATHAALARGCPVIGVTSGGTLESVLDQADQSVILVPGGGQPRHSTGSLLVPVVRMLELDRGLDAAIARLETVVAASHRDVPTTGNPAKGLATRLAGADSGIPALYGTYGVGAVAAYRLRSQLAENAQMRASNHEVPELSHNEVVAWADRDTTGAVLWLAEDKAQRRQIDVLRELFGDRFAWDELLEADGEGPLERYASLSGLLDLVSVYTAIARGIDPTPVEPISMMKDALA